MTSQKIQKILLSGIKPTGSVHIGNYFGAMKPNVSFQDEYKTYLPIVDYHALTTLHDKNLMSRYIFELAIDYLAVGLNPEKTVLFKQSDVSEHTELAWIFNCITTMPYLKRAHAYKDATVKNKEISVGVFDYPMLMASDILLYDADIVPVGADQKQHIEYTRDTAEKFNNLFGKTFKLPTALISNDLGVVPGTDGKKMSKSYNNTIPLFTNKNDLKKIIMSIATNSTPQGKPLDTKTCTIFALHKIFSTKQIKEIEDNYIKGSVGYKESKELLLQNIESFLSPLREKRLKLHEEYKKNDCKKMKDLLNDGAKKAKVVATKKMNEVRQKIGVMV